MNASWWPRRWRARGHSAAEGALVWLRFWPSRIQTSGRRGSRRGVGVLFSRWVFDLFAFARVASAGLPRLGE